MKLHSRIFALLAIILLGLGASSMVFLYQSSKSKVESDVAEQLIVAQNTFYEVLNNQRRLLNASVETVVKDWGLRQSIGQRDYITLKTVLQNHSARVGADVALFVDNEGAFSVSTVSTDTALSEHVVNLVQQSTKKTFQRVAAIDGKYYQLVLTEVKAPIRVGWLGMGFVIDDAMAKHYSQLSGVNISFVLSSGPGLKIVASSLPTEKLNGVLQLATMGEEDKPWLIQQGWEDLALFRRFDVESNSALGVLLQQSLDEPRQKFSQWWLSLLSIFSLISVLALALGYIISRGISKPLIELMHVADDVSKGDYNTSIRLDRSDEIGVLSKAFARMQKAVSEREERITFQANHDGLTGLLNRAGLVEHISQGLQQIDSTKQILVVANFRLNHFQAIVDALGYSWGDKLIHLVTRRLQDELDQECLAHLNLDEFVLTGVVNDLGDARKINDKVHRVFIKAFNVSGIELSLTVAVGISVYPFSADSAEGLLRRAGVALNEAVKSRRGTVIYDPKHDENSLRKLTLMSELPKAIKENQVCLHYQPKLARIGNEVAIQGVECLVRWVHPDLGFVPPDDFIELAEKTGYVVELTQWVMATAIQQCIEWRSQGMDIAVAVNISALDLQQKDFDHTVANLLKKYQLPAESLIIEVTESAAVENPESAVAQLSTLKKLGIKLSVDDYGTGYSSLGQLKQLPVHELKIDKSFVQELAHNKEDQTIVRSTIELAHNIGLSVVAEGVEDKPSLDQLLAWGCNYIQGYYVAKPMDAEAMMAWLASTQYPVRTLEHHSVSLDISKA